jgi:hypothetical protein
LKFVNNQQLAHGIEIYNSELLFVHHDVKHFKFQAKAGPLCTSSKDRAEEHFLLECDTLLSDRLTDSSDEPIILIFGREE